MTAPSPSSAADPRLLQANERTLLAWVRTGIALVAFGCVIARFSLVQDAPTSGPFAFQRTTPWLGAVFVALGILANALAVKRYTTTRHAIINNQSLPTDDPLPLIFTCLLTIACALIGVYSMFNL